MLNEPPTDDRTLEEVWQRKVRETGNQGMSDADLEQAQYVFMMGAHACLYLLAVLAPSPSSIESVVAAVEALNNEVMKFVAERERPN